MPLWEVIENGVSLPKTQVMEVLKRDALSHLAEDKAQRRLELKDRNSVLRSKVLCIDGSNGKWELLGYLFCYNTRIGPLKALKMIVPLLLQEKVCQENDVKARSILLMASPNETSAYL
ncbi:hypothetical protein Tco_0097846 [Tanacetum coccineum]